MKLYTGTSPWIGSHLYILIESKQFSVFHGKSPRRRLTLEHWPKMEL